MSVDDKGCRGVSDSEQQDCSAEIDLDSCFALLSDSRRRAVIRYFGERQTHAVDIDELTEYIYANTTDEALTHSDILTSLIHIHLPKLSNAGVLEHDPVRHTVTYRGSELMEDVLDVVRGP